MNYKPGPELDALIAEHVMGYAKPKLVDGIYFINYESEDYHSVEPYSTDIATAWLVVEKINSFHFILERFSTKQYKASFGFKDGSTKMVTWVGPGPMPRVNLLEATADTAPHAICLAALKALK